jgi:hypothetical protein
MIGVGCLFTDTVGGLNLSATAEPDGNFTGFNKDRYLPPAVGMLEHPLQSIVVLEDVDVFERNLSTGEVLAGSRSIGTKIMTENQHFFYRHGLRLLRFGGAPSIIDLIRPKLSGWAVNCKERLH